MAQEVTSTHAQLRAVEGQWRSVGSFIAPAFCSRTFVIIGNDTELGQQSPQFKLSTLASEGVGPRHRFMSAYEQKIEPLDRRCQYVMFAAKPYETIAFKVSIR